MKFLSTLFAVALIGGAAHATETFKYHYSNINAYYACSYAEAQVAKTLIVLGAQGVTTTCTGGIDHGQFMPVSVTATYEGVVKGQSQVTIKGRESCEFNVKLINAAVDQLGHEVASAKSNCWDASGNYKYVINLL